MMKAFRISIAVLSTITLTQVMAVSNAQATDVKSLMRKWDRENERCRGGRGDDPKTDAACERREKLYATIEKLGWCYGEDDQATASWQWHRCRKR